MALRRLSTGLRRTVLLAAASGLLGACSPNYAPPLRAVLPGAPGRLRAGDVEVGGAVANPFGGLLPVGGPQAGVGLRDGLSLHLGGNFSGLADRDNWALGWAGPRFTVATSRAERLGFALDVDLAAGAGVGGRCTDACAPAVEAQAVAALPWKCRAAQGLSSSAGAGVRYGPASLFLRGQLEGAWARGVPATLWSAAALGAEWDFAHRVVVTGSAGYLGLFNESLSGASFFWQLGVAVLLDGFRPARDEGDRSGRPAHGDAAAPRSAPAPSPAAPP